MLKLINVEISENDDIEDLYDSRLKPIRACALMWGISRTGICCENGKNLIIIN